MHKPVPAFLGLHSIIISLGNGDPSVNEKIAGQDPVPLRILIAKIYLTFPTGLLRVIFKVTADIPLDVFLRLENSEMSFTQYVRIEGEELLHRFFPPGHIGTEDV